MFNFYLRGILQDKLVAAYTPVLIGKRTRILQFNTLLGLLHIENLPTQLATTPEPSCLQSVSFFGQWPLQQSCLQAQALVQWVARKRATYGLLDTRVRLLPHLRTLFHATVTEMASSGAIRNCLHMVYGDRANRETCVSPLSWSDRREQTSSLSCSKAPSSDGELGTLSHNELSSA